MADTSDQTLIREYADCNSEAAFSELVHQHIHLVYSVAFRYAGNTADAQDVTQAVFVILAKKAAGLRHRTTLTGWLYETTRLTAAALVRTRTRQQARDHEAYMQSTLNDPETNEVWRHVAPVLEEAMGRLNEKERTVLALRLFENKTAAQTAALLGMQTNAAHKRTSRALEKLRQFFLQRGISSSTVLLAKTISVNAIQVAPAPLANSVVAAAMVKGAAANSSTLILIKGALRIMTWSKVKTAIVAGAIVLLAAGGATMVVKHVENQRQKSGMQGRFFRNEPIVGPIMKISPDGKVSVVHFLPGRGPGPDAGFVANMKIHASRDEILRQLDQMHAVVLSNTPDLLLAESSKPPKTEMTFKFVDGKVATVMILHKPATPISVGR